jgi:hypothetical protein
VAAGAALGAGGYAAYRGAQNAAEQDTRMQDYMANMRHDLNSPLPSMTVTASYEKFAAEKLAAPDAMYMTVPSAMAKSLGDTLSQKLVADPIDALHSKLRKKMVDEPAWENNFNAAVASDPMLSRIHTENPDMLRNAFASVKRFSPSLAKDLLATRNLMRHVAMSGGEMDHATMKLLAETEKFHNESRRR